MINAGFQTRRPAAAIFVVTLLLVLSTAGGYVIPNLFELDGKTRNLLGLILVAALYGLALLVNARFAIWVAFLLSIVFIAFTGFQYELRPGTGFRVSALDCFVGSFAVVQIFSHKRKSDYWGYLEPRLKRAVLFWLWMIPLGIAVSVWRGVDWFEMLAMIKLFYYPMLFLYIIPRIVKTKAHLRIVLAIAIFCAVASGLTSRVEGPAIDQPYERIATTVKVERSAGQFGTQNPFANYLLFAVLLPLAFATRVDKPVRSVAMAGACVIGVWALLGTFTRGAWLGCAVGASYLAVGDKLSKTLVLLLVVAVMLPVLPSTVLNRINNIDDSSTKRRMSLWQTGYHATLAYPALGAGWGSSFNLVGDTLSPVTGLPWWHNDYLIVSSQVGLAGLYFFLNLWFTIVVMGVKAARRTKDSFYRPVILGLTASLIAAMVHGIFEHVFWRFETAPHTWFLAGCLLVAVLHSKEQNKRLLEEAV